MDLRKAPPKINSSIISDKKAELIVNSSIAATVSKKKNDTIRLHDFHKVYRIIKGIFWLTLSYLYYIDSNIKYGSKL